MQPRVATDGAGGALVVWHNRPDGSEDDGYIQRLTSSGAFAPGWTAAGTAFVVAAGHQVGFFLLPDSVGGTYIAWSDTRDLGSTDYDAYIQRVTGEGQIAPGWPDDGLPICTVRLLQALPVMAADGQGGVFVVWEDERAASGTRDIYAQHVRKEGTLFEGWPDQGLPLSTAPEQQAGPSVVPDGELGAIVGWSDGRNGRRSSYAVRIDAGGALLPGWVSDGTLVSFTGFGAMLVPDGEGGAFVGMLDDRTRPPGRIDYPYIDIYVQRVRGDGTIAPDWPADGAPVCTATQLQQAHQIAPDLTGGVFLAWEDYRAGSGDAYVQRIMPDGSIAPGWPVNGLRVSTWSGYEGLPHLAPDGAGGCYVIYEDFSNYRVYCQHVSGAGDLRWGANGLLVSPLPTYGQQYASIAADSRGVAIVAWEETRTNGSDYDVYAQRIGLDGPTAVLISLVETETEADRVRLTWHGPEAAGLVATVYRRSESEDWRSLAELIADGSGRLVYEDRDVSPGGRYGYKLGYRDGALESFTAETWVTLPSEFRLALEGLRPNPAANEMNVAFTLGHSTPASLEMLDLGGRRITSREVGGLGSGRHLLRLGETRALAPGVYWLRLRQGGHLAVTKALIVR